MLNITNGNMTKNANNPDKKESCSYFFLNLGNCAVIRAGQSGK
jgi:hypothetical protein